MNNFTKGILVGSLVGAALGITGWKDNPWVKKKVWKPSRRAMKKVGKVMSEMADMM